MGKTTYRGRGRERGEVPTEQTDSLETPATSFWTPIFLIFYVSREPHRGDRRTVQHGRCRRRPCPRLPVPYPGRPAVSDNRGHGKNSTTVLDGTTTDGTRRVPLCLLCTSDSNRRLSDDPIRSPPSSNLRHVESDSHVSRSTRHDTKTHVRVLGLPQPSLGPRR